MENALSPVLSKEEDVYAKNKVNSLMDYSIEFSYISFRLELASLSFSKKESVILLLGIFINKIKVLFEL